MWILALIFIVVYTTRALRALRAPGSAQHALLYTLGWLQGTRVEFVSPITDPALVTQVLASSDKGHLVEYLIARGEWAPIVSIESESVEVSGRMTRKLHTVLKCIHAYERLPILLQRLCVGNGTCDETMRLVFNVFFTLLLYRDPTREESDLACAAANEYRKALAVKARANPHIKRDFFVLMRTILKSSPIADFIDLDLDEDLSVILQPLIISPMINVPDILVALHTCLDNRPDLRSKTDYHGIILEAIRCHHPFPLYERVLHRAVAGLPCGTHVIVHHDQPSSFNPEQDSKLYAGIPFGTGPRRCAGRRLAIPLLHALLTHHAAHWESFHPAVGHRYSGRHNDICDADSVHMVRVLVQCVLHSVYLGACKLVASILI
jgi:hypothetical protein